MKSANHGLWNFNELRVNMRTKGDKIYKHLLARYYPKKLPKNIKMRCVFCGSSKNLTKEHIIPSWIAEQFHEPYFTSMINRTAFNFYKATVPACSNCNNKILGGIERHVTNRFKELGVISQPLSKIDLDMVIRWLEIIDYKLQVMNFIQRFIILRGTDFDRNVANIPLGVLRRDLTPKQGLEQLKQTIRRLGTKSKKSRHQAFQQFHRVAHGGGEVFLHGMGNFVALEIPTHRVALFYFYKKKFASQKELYASIEQILKNEASPS